MTQSNSDPTPSRLTLKLKTGPRKPAEPSSNQPIARPQPQSKASQKPGAQWSDEYKQRMQADMDALASKRPAK
jgi:hypothetical protein